MAKSNPAIDAVIDAAVEIEARLPVKFELDALSSGVYITNFDRIGGSKGDGAKALAALTAAADRHSVDLSLSVLEGNPDLIRYYHRFGFRVTDGPPSRENSLFEDYEAEWHEAQKRGEQTESISVSRPAQSQPGVSRD